MNEFKRVILRRRYLITVILLYIMNAVIFQVSQSATLEILKDDSSFERFVNDLKEKQQKEHREFYEKIDRIPEEKERLLAISIFADEESFAYKDIIKTSEDYAVLSDVVLSDVNDFAVNEVLDYKYMYVIGFIIILITVLAFMEDKKRGLAELIYSCRNGRMVLTLKRILMLLFVSFITMTVLITSVLAISFMDYGGADILTASVQSVGSLQNFVLPVSLICFLVYYILYLSMAYTVCGLVVWAVLSLIRNRNLGIIVCVLIYGSSYFMYRFIPKGLSISILKYTNLWFLLEPGETYTQYTNFPFFDTIINLREYMEIVIVVMLAVMCLIVLVIGAKLRPCYVPGLIVRYMERLTYYYRKKLCLLSGFSYEVYKQLVLRKGIFVIAIFVWVLIAWIDDAELVLSPGRELLDDFYAEYSGEIDGRSLKAYEDIHKQVGDYYLNETEPGNNLEFMFSQLMQQKEHADKLSERGISGWFLNDRGYERLLGKDGDIRSIVQSILSLVVTVLIASFSYVTEYADGVSTLIRSTKRGRGIVFRRKTIYVILMTGLICVIRFAANMYEVRLGYRLEGLSAPVQNIRFLEGVGYDISIGGFVCLWYMTRFSVLLACSCIAMLISVYGKHTGKVCAAAFLLVPLGVLCQYIIPYLVAAPLIIIAMLPLMICIAISAVCLYRIYRKW